jgi:hypothetical protein
MISRPSERQYVRRGAALLLLCAVLLRALIPVGFMPDMSSLAAGEFRLVICTGHGPMAAEMLQPALASTPAADLLAQAHPGHSKKSPAGPMQQESGICPFAAALAFFAPVLLPILAALFLRPQPALFFAEARALRFGRCRAPWSARGPPLIA